MGQKKGSRRARAGRSDLHGTLLLALGGGRGGTQLLALLLDDGGGGTQLLAMLLDDGLKKYG